MKFKNEMRYLYGLEARISFCTKNHLVQIRKNENENEENYQ